MLEISPPLHPTGWQTAAGTPFGSLYLALVLQHCVSVMVGLQVNSIPFVGFDAGGVLELFDYTLHNQSIVWEATAEALSVRLQDILAAGQMQTVQLHEKFLTGRQRWLQWHAAYSANMTQMQKVR